MSIVVLLIVASVLGAIAFFFSGFLLRGGRVPSMAVSVPAQSDAAAEVDRLRQQLHEQLREAERWRTVDRAAKQDRAELAAAQAKLAEHEQTLDENRRLRDEVADLRRHEEDSRTLERLTIEHKQVRLDAELLGRRVQELTQEREQLVGLRSEAAEATMLAEEVAYLRRREKELEARLYASGAPGSREIQGLSGEVLAPTVVTNMEHSLSALVTESGPRTAVLADAQGFLIAAAGEATVQEPLAAFAAAASEMLARARMLLPIGSVGSLRVIDENRVVLTCHLFDSLGEELGVATLGRGEPEHSRTSQTIRELNAIVSASHAG